MSYPPCIDVWKHAVFPIRKITWAFCVQNFSEASSPRSYSFNYYSKHQTQSPAPLISLETHEDMWLKTTGLALLLWPVLNTKSPCYHKLSRMGHKAFHESTSSEKLEGLRERDHKDKDAPIAQGIQGFKLARTKIRPLFRWGQVLYYTYGIIWLFNKNSLHFIMIIALLNGLLGLNSHIGSKLKSVTH